MSNFEESMEAAVYQRLLQAAERRRLQSTQHLQRCLLLPPADRPAPPPGQEGALQ